jgi:uncharacterized repeat protein (TIGR03806 family)
VFVAGPDPFPEQAETAKFSSETHDMRWLLNASLQLSLFCLVTHPFVTNPTILNAEDSEPAFGMTERVPWTTSRIVGTPDPPSKYTAQRAFPKVKFSSPVYVAQEPGTERFFVAELGGKIFAFTKETPDDAARELILDTKRQIYSFSFHPRYEENGQIFVFSPSDPEDKSKEEDRRSRVSRFTTNLDHPRKSSLDKEVVIIEWLAGGHNGGEAIIGPDGFLYICTGDTTSGSDPKATGQGVDDLYSVMMRLDVEHPASGQAYSIPPDNPFINFPGARPEIWAFGFRNPWRMSFNEKTGDLWVGDVGQDLWEMIRVVQRGGNYGWSVQEGSHPFHPEKPIGPGPIIPPVIEHHHTECRSITGGYVYHGSKFPELQGAYFYGDYEYGQVWALRYDGQRVTWQDELADTALRIASFGVGRDGEIYLVDHPTGELYTLERAPEQVATAPFPKKLSETGLFSSVSDHQVAPGMIPYTVNAPQWVDGGTKQRYAGIPSDLKADFVEDPKSLSPWTFPDGTVHLETISLEMTSGTPDSSRRIETRILVKQQNHWLGYSYLWNDEQTDAELVGSRGLDLKLQVSSGASDQPHQQTWRIPSRDECMACHSRAAGFVLGLSTSQMNRTHDYAGVTDNQLRAWNHAGLFSKPLEKPPAEYPVMPNPYSEAESSASAASVDARARAWLQVNCSVCHVADGGGNAKLEVSFHKELRETKLIDEQPLHGTFDLPDARLIVPGDPFSSVLFYRLSKLGRGRMPHVSSRQHDSQGIRLIHDWIRQLPALPPIDATVADASTKPENSDTKKKDAAATETEEKKEPAAETNVVAEPAPAAAESAKAYERTLTQLQSAGLLQGTEQTDALKVMLTNPRTAFMASYAVSQNGQSAPWKTSLVQTAMLQTNANIRDLFERFVPEEDRIQRLGDLVDPHLILERAGDIERGRQLFFGNASQCRNCHRIRQEGGLIGPELTEIGKKYKPEELLESIAEPSRKIDPKYIPHSLQTTAGKVYNGILVEKSDTTVVLNVLQGAETQQVKIPAADVEELVPQAKSLMPDGMLRDLTAGQAADLIAFLSSLK